MKFTTRGRITLLRDGVAISTHVLAEEAYERAYAHAQANGPGKYTVRYPDREVDLSTLTRIVLEAAPTGISATPASASAINLAWTANPRAASYRVYRNGTLVGSPTGVTYSDTGLSASTAYTYTVSTVSASTGEGPVSAGVVGTTLAAPDTTAPTAPTITATATGQNTVSVALTTPATDAQSGVANYDLEYKTAAASTYSVITPVTAGQFPYVIGSLSAGTQYNHRARARDVAGNVGAYSAVSNATTNSASGTANALYPALDMASVLFHNGAGGWGAQVAFQTAATPNITRSVNASTLAELQSAVSVAGTRVTLTGNILGGSISGSLTDIEIVVPNGILVRGLGFATYRGSEVAQRVRFTKASGDTIGGQIHNLAMFGASVSDLIFDGLQLSADAAGFAIPTYIDTLAGSRHAYLRNRIASTVAGYGYGVPHLLVCGNSVLHDANNAGNGGDWGFRCSARGPYIFYQNDIRGPNYSHVRFHPASGSGGYYAWLADNTTVDLDTADFGRTFDFFETDGTAGLPNINGAWVLNNRFYVGTAGLFMQVQRNVSGGTVICDYMRVNGNFVFGATSGLTTGGTPDADSSGNTYNGATAVAPAWGAAGDPSTINLSP